MEDDDQPIIYIGKENQNQKKKNSKNNNSIRF